MNDPIQMPPVPFALGPRSLLHDQMRPAYAFHEAGHAIVGVALGFKLVEVAVRVERVDAEGVAIEGHCLFDDRHIEHWTDEVLFRDAVRYLAGEAAQHRGASWFEEDKGRSDRRGALQSLRLMESPRTYEEAWREADRIVAIPTIWAAITLTARALLDREVMTGREVAEDFLYARGWVS